MKDLLDNELQTGDEIVNELKQKYEDDKRDKTYMYAYIVGAMTAKYDLLKLQLEMLNKKYQKT